MKRKKSPCASASRPRLHPSAMVRIRRCEGAKGVRNGVARLVASHDAIVSAFNPVCGNQGLHNIQFKDTRAIITSVNKAGDCTIAVGQQDRQFGGSTGSLRYGSAGIRHRVYTGSARDARRPEHAAKRITPGLVFLPPLPTTSLRADG
jgi:hypothetical protein